MCVVSMIGDHYADKWRHKPIWPPYEGGPSRAEFDTLRKEVEEMKELLKRAKEYDERNGEPDCEVDEKMALLRRIADAVGISLDDVLTAKH